MPNGTPAGLELSARTLMLAFALIIGSFLAADVAVQRSSARIGELSERLIESLAPSVEHLGNVRRGVLETEVALARFVHEPELRPQWENAVEESLLIAEEGLRDYLAVPHSRGEDVLNEDVRQSFQEFTQRVKDTQAVATSGSRDEAVSLLSTHVHPSAHALRDRLTSAIELNSASGRDVATEIHDVRLRTAWLGNVLTALCLTLSTLTATLLYRQSRARRALFDEHTRLLEQRAAELERFAGRVAHDIRNPLSAAGIAAELALRKLPDDETRQPIHRLKRSLARADELTSGLLEFARAAAKPDPGARIAPARVIRDAVAEFAAEADQRGIRIQLATVPPVLVPCSAGVYLSLVGNLVRNAIKYMGDAREREIRVQVIDRGAVVRTEVTDTGPGVRVELRESIFQPYFKGQQGSEGLGLGLATVKKLAEAHGGTVGLASEVGRGSTFWFELPRAGIDDELAHAESLEEAPPPTWH